MLINTNGYNVWLRKPLLAAYLYDVEYHPWEYKTHLKDKKSQGWG